MSHEPEHLEQRLAALPPRPLSPPAAARLAAIARTAPARPPRRRAVAVGLAAAAGLALAAAVLTLWWLRPAAPPPPLVPDLAVVREPPTPVSPPPAPTAPDRQAAWPGPDAGIVRCNYHDRELEVCDEGLVHRVAQPPVRRLRRDVVREVRFTDERNHTVIMQLPVKQTVYVPLEQY